MSSDSVARFVEARIDQMLEKPALWGSLASVEDQVLQFLELRRVMAEPPSDPRSSVHTRAVMDAFTEFADRFVPGNDPLALRLERVGRTAEFSARMQEFVAEERRRVRLVRRLSSELIPLPQVTAR